MSMWKHVIILHEQAKTMRITEDKLAKQNDTLKQRYYRKMHGIEETNPVHKMFGKPEMTDAQVEAEVLGRELTVEEQQEVEEQPRKKWFGIF